ncbi:MAG: polymer-forming cytoskeletal protein [bacterium]|jgi:cytoskeletal protein CcmA (bactofilin family)
MLTERGVPARLVVFVFLVFAASMARAETPVMLAAGRGTDASDLSEEEIREKLESLEGLEELAGVDLSRYLDLDEGDILKIGQSYTVPEDMEVEGNVVVIGGALTVAGSIKGNAVVIGGSSYLTSTSVVEGDAAVFGGILQMEDGALVWGETIEQSSIEPEEKRFVIELEPEIETITKEDIVKLTGDIYVGPREYVTGDIVAITGSITIEGRVDGEVVAPMGSITLASTAEIDGSVMAPLGTINIEEGAVVLGEIESSTQVYCEPSTREPVCRPDRKYEERLTYKFLYYNPDAEYMALTGDFIDWDPEGIAMVRDEYGTWTTLYSLPPGEYKYKFIIDGEAVPDPDIAEKVPDGMGGWATPLVVESRKRKATRVYTVEWCPREIEVGAAVDYNRVDGFYLGMNVKNSCNNFPMPRFEVEGGYAWARHKWMGSVELEQPLVSPFTFSLGGRAYSRTDTYDDEVIGDGENFLAAFFIKRDYRDYFDRRGATGFVGFYPSQDHSFRFSYTADDYRPLEKNTNWSLFRSDENFPENPRYAPSLCQCCGCDVVRVRAFQADYEFDTRNNKKTPYYGAWARLSGEWARRSYGSDLGYSRYVADMRYYDRLSSRQRLSARIKAGVMTMPDDSHSELVPEPQYFFPKEFYVGGLGTMPGYCFKEFRGTQMMLFNFEYALGVSDSWYLLFFTDGGDALGTDQYWKDAWDAMKIKWDGGFGVRFERPGTVVTVHISQRFDDWDRSSVVTLRLNRMF